MTLNKIATIIMMTKNVIIMYANDQIGKMSFDSITGAFYNEVLATKNPCALQTFSDLMREVTK